MLLLFFIPLASFSFTQFSARCRKEWLAIKSSAGGTPLVLCGSKLPPPVEFPGGNITVVHHFLPHIYPVSSFRLDYVRGAFVRLWRGFNGRVAKGGFNVYVEFLEKNSVTLQCNIHLGNYFGALSKFEIFNLVIIKTMKFFCGFFLDS